jgi:hypothetical protein
MIIDSQIAKVQLAKANTVLPSDIAAADEDLFSAASQGDCREMRAGAAYATHIALSR